MSVEGKAESDWIHPEWPAPRNVAALMTTRNGGVSTGAYAGGDAREEQGGGLNLGAHCGDDVRHVATNRGLLRAHLPGDPCWLRQVHGRAVVEAASAEFPPEADASIASSPDRVCAVLVADCMPVLFCDRHGTRVAAAHAGWRGLARGVIEATVSALDVPAADLFAWLGPAIGPRHFEVGDEVRAAFVDQERAAATAFAALGNGKWLADLEALVRRRLAACGVHAVFGGGLCTVSEAGRFYSYRRERVTGRMAALIWLRA